MSKIRQDLTNFIYQGMRNCHPSLCWEHLPEQLVSFDCLCISVIIVFVSLSTRTFLLCCNSQIVLQYSIFTPLMHACRRQLQLLVCILSHAEVLYSFHIHYLFKVLAGEYTLKSINIEESSYNYQ